MKAFFVNLVIAAIASALVLVAAEFALRGVLGLGDPVLYDNNPIYGYRPLPNQLKSRFHGAQIRTNNLGMRCDEDWDATTRGKILFLGDSVTYGGSHVSNAELFSSLVGTGIGSKACSGGVNGWGVENIHALVIEFGFMPAETYVTTLIEGDFYRGVTRMQGLPFFNKKPAGAIDELLQFLFYQQMNRRYLYWEHQATEELKDRVVERAVRRLKEMDDALQRRGYRHHIFISPTRAQAVDGVLSDARVGERLAAHKLPVVYIHDRLPRPGSQLAGVYHDHVHLNAQGHRLWADVIRKELDPQPR